MRIPRIVLAGTHSGVGKTTLATGLMAALKERGRPVQGYKVGPDYIDPSYHTAVTGRPSRNLDRWLLGNHLLPLFAQSSRGTWAVIEGVMGMFDGMKDSPGFGSTADIAKILKSPVVLVVDATAMSRSIAALVHGFRTFDSGIYLAGVILNRVKSLAQEHVLREALVEIDMPVLGVIPREAGLKMPERHLGLVPYGERPMDEGFWAKLTELCTNYLDLDAIEQIMQEAPELDVPSPEPAMEGKKKKTIRLGVAWDEAFLFYYQDALELAEQYGFQLVLFSPLHDQKLPADLDSLFFGGGFPELYLEALSSNHSFLASLKDFARQGKPIYAECGGYMYLGEFVKDFEGKSYSLAGLIPMYSEMTPRLQGLGYREGVFLQDTFLGTKGTVVRGHEFHYSRTIFEHSHKAAYHLFRGGVSERMDGFAGDNIVASYLHINFAGHPELLEYWSKNLGSNNLAKGHGDD